MIAYRDDPEEVARSLARLPFPCVPLGQGDFLAGLCGPILVTEYIENGVFLKLIKRLQAQKAPLANRVIWFIYLCGKFIIFPNLPFIYSHRKTLLIRAGV